MLVDHYNNRKNYPERDRYIELIRAEFSDLTDRRENLMAAYEAGRNGRLMEAYRLFAREAAYDSLDVFINTAGRYMAQFYAANDRRALELCDLIPLDSIDFDQCVYCAERLRCTTLALTRMISI